MKSLTQKMLELYSFVNDVFVEDKNFLNRRITRLERKNLKKTSKNFNKPIDLVRDSVEQYVSELFLNFEDYGISYGKENIPKEFQAELEKLRQNAERKIVDKFLKVMRKEMSEDDSLSELEKETSIIETRTKNDIRGIYRQIKFCMVLSKYEKQGIKFYRFRSMPSACDECLNRNEVVFFISEAFNNRHYFDSHPNCKCVVELIDENGNLIATLDTNGNVKKDVLDSISEFLTYASLVPGIDTIADLLAIPVDLLRGDFVSAGLDLIGLVPFYGEVADTAKIAKTVDKAVDAGKIVNKVSDATRTIERIPPSKLMPTHKLTLNSKQYSSLVESIRTNGIIEPIKYVEHNGIRYVVDGHHRLMAAKQLKLDEIPVEKVLLPYKGYKTIIDLLWFD